VPRPAGARDADYEEKRKALLWRMTVRLMRRETARPSLRQLAEAAGVAVPTLRHYFGDRRGVMEAILANYLEAGRARLAQLSEPVGDLETSVRDYGYALLRGLRAPREVRLGDVFAVAIAEGLLDAGVGPAALRFVLDPSVEILEIRLKQHIARGEMRPTDTRTAALMLLAPLLLAMLHQDQMGGSDCNPLDLERLIDETCAAFVRAYGAR
jgi:AcrR family transcriptional regulator